MLSPILTERSTSTPLSIRPPGLLTECTCCGRRCRVPVTVYSPLAVREAYAIAGWDHMATCQEGALAEHRRFGASYADVIVERFDRVLGGARAPDRAGVEFSAEVRPALTSAGSAGA